MKKYKIGRNHITTFRINDVFYIVKGVGLLGEGEPPSHPNNIYHIEHVHNGVVEHEIAITTAPFLPWIPKKVRDAAEELLYNYEKERSK